MWGKLTEGDAGRLAGLLKTAQAELIHLQQTDQRFFYRPFSPEGLAIQLEEIDFSERVEAFVTRFGRLQDLLGDHAGQKRLRTKPVLRSRKWRKIPKKMAFNSIN